MLSIQEARDLIEGDEEYSDAEIEQIRNDIQSLAEMAMDCYVDEKTLDRSLVKS
jgi:hypothetical protein